ncbi:unnamed protein product [Porites evermanni]|uniref:SWIM-type domain-containing protein n=1 Tax=Porites evermanni TaxID=104178 RepID=A0ABN8LNY8_9CNID|nr:unnamed protein product [Porites evermanni]
MLPDKTQRAVDLAFIPLKDMDFDLNKREFRDAVRLRYDSPIPDNPSVCVCGSMFTVDHAMICQRGGLVIQRHNEIRDLQAELLDMVCYDVQVEPALQPITDEELARGTNQAPEAHLSPKKIYRIHENEKKRKYNSRVTEIEQGTFTPLGFTTTGEMTDECLRYHSRLAELLSAKKQESYATIISWVRAKVSFAILRSALLCLRGSRTPRRRNIDVKDRDLEIEEVRESLPSKTERAVKLATEKGASNWLTVIPIKEMNFNLNKREFRDAIKLRYDWEIADLPAMCTCGDLFTVDHAMVCRHGGLIIQRHNEIRDLEAEMLRMVCTDVETEPVLQEITGEELNRGANKAPDARLDVHARGFWDRQQSAFFDVRVCHPNADSYRELSPKQIFQLHENEKKRQYSRRVLEVEQGTFTPLVFTSTGGMADECKRFHSRLAELLALKKGDDYATTISWIRAKVSFAILRSALLCLRGTRSKRKAANISDIDITSESAQARI